MHAAEAINDPAGDFNYRSGRGNPPAEDMQAFVSK